MHGKSRIEVPAAASQLLLLCYLEVVEWVDLFPWNDVRHGNGQQGLDVVLGLLIAGAAAAYRRWRPGMVAATILYALWMGLQVATFWLPYVRGASPEWQRIYERNFARTIQWLPRSGTHLPPDANHIVLQLVLASALICTALAAWRNRRSASQRRGA
jgi:hypothetical protein